jgi:hypothetical protein
MRAAAVLAVLALGACDVEIGCGGPMADYRAAVAYSQDPSVRLSLGHQVAALADVVVAWQAIPLWCEGRADKP